ncbi:MAG: M23 family metallopeptidase [Gammaproteobacteria bacterium]
MNIILFTTVHGRPGSLNLSRPRCYIPLLLAILVFCGLLVYGGYHLAGPGGQTGVAATSLHEWRAEMEQQQRALEQARRSSQDHLDALALRVAQIQAQAMRIDGLGQRLVDLTDLDVGEFNFSEVPAQGGPVEASEQDLHYAEPDFMQELELLSAQLKDRERQLIVLEDLLQDRQLNALGRPSGRPVADGWLSSPFGRRTDPFTGRPALHAGVDFAGKAGSDIVAVAAGVVTWSSQRSGYGMLVEINHGNGYVTRYAHNQRNLVGVGQSVKKGQRIALMGSSGRSTGPHVHFEVHRDGKPVNPARYLTAAR